MTANGRVTLAWADGDHVFNLAKIGQILELEDKCDCGVMEVFNRLREGRWKFHDVRETVRLGLIGGGMEPQKALVLTKRYVDDRPWQESVHVALTILMASIVGIPDDQPGKPEADRAASEASTTTTDASSDLQSTASAPDSTGIPDRSTSSPSGKSQPASKATTARTAASPSQNP